MKKSKKSNNVDAFEVEEKKDETLTQDQPAELNLSNDAPVAETPMSDNVAVSEETSKADETAKPEEAVTTEEVKADGESKSEEVVAPAQEPNVEEAEKTDGEEKTEEIKADDEKSDKKKSKKDKKNKKDKKADEEPVEEVKSDEEPKAEEVVVEEDKSSKKKGKKDKKSAKPADGAKKSEKVGGYIKSLLKYFNLVTILPITCIFYVIFFASDIVDGVAFVESNKLMVVVMVAILAVMLVIWMVDNRKKRRVCSLDAFLLISLLLCFGMILQCVILDHFKTFDVTAIMTIAMTVFVLVFMTIRLCMFKPEEQRKDDDARYVAKSQLGLYFKVIFSKYALFISTLCVMGILLILVVTKSEMLEKFEFAADKTEKVVTMLFAAVALVLMVISLFIRIVRGRANIVDCMPYVFILFAIGTLLNFFTSKIYMMLYLAIGSGVVGVIWLCLCQYTFYRKLYDKKFAPAIVHETVLSIEPPVEETAVVEEPVVEEEPIIEEEPIVEEPVIVEEPIIEEEPIVEEEPIIEEPVVVEEPIVEEEPVVEEQPVVEEPAVEETPVAVVEEVEEEDEDADEEEEEEEEVSIKSIRPRYDYTTKMKLASDDLKAFYSEIKNEFYSYGIKSRISKAKENFNKGREMIARFVINGKSLKLYMALDPTLLDQKYFHHKDMSEKKAVAEIPTMLLIRSKQSVSRAKELIAMLAEKVELAKKPRYKEKDFSEDLSAEGLTLTQRKGYGYLIRNEIKLEDVELMTDEFAEVLADVSTDESKSMRFIKTTVTLAEIAEHFEDEDIVTIDTIRECGIGAQNANYLIVEESEKLNKKLKVYVDEITPNALKMIALAGGEVYKIWRKM
ncbi:MAG: uL15 family ribosomal protein [Clostridia bacterium]|nr:uL15 family ribosomal protein [Clostridia bacterium]